MPKPHVYRHIIALAVFLSAVCTGAASPAYALTLDMPEQNEQTGQEILPPTDSQRQSAAPEPVAADNTPEAQQNIAEEERLSSEEEAVIAEFSEDEEAYDLLLRVKKGQNIISEAMIGLQKGYDNYVPMLDLARIVQFAAEPDFSAGTVSGFFIEQDNTYRLNVSEGSYSVRGETFSLPPDSVIVRDAGYGLGEFYVKPEVLNEIWPLELELNFSSLTLIIETDQKLPYELAQEREERRKELFRGEAEEIDTENYPYVGNEYQMFSKPFLDLTNTLTVRQRNNGNNITDRFSLRGQNDFLKTAADYNLTVRSDEKNRLDPVNARLRLTRKTYGDDTMPLGLRKVEAGDVRYIPSDLIGNNLSGRGIAFSTDPNERLQNFDTVTITGTGEPGWEVEIFRRNELLAFGQIDERGEYVFNDIPLLYGNNRIEVLLYGPQGQVEKRVENYRISNQLVTPGETRFNGAVLDNKKDLIPLQDGTAEEGTGLSYNAEVRRGISENVTGFTSFTHAPTEDGNKTYGSVGADVSFDKGIGKIEGYIEGGGGTALDTRYATEYAGVRLNLRQSLYNNFESEEADFGEDAKTSETEISANKSFRTGVGNFNLSGRGEHTIRDSYDETTLNLGQSYSNRGFRVNNRLRTRWRDGEKDRTNGILSLDYRFLDNWDLHSNLIYDLYPEVQERRYYAEVRYDDYDKFSASVDVDHDLLTKQTTYGAEASYDFEKLRASIGVDHKEDRGTDVKLRTSTTLAPVGENGEYVASRQNVGRRALLKARVFLDKNLDGEFGPEDEPLEGVKVKINGRNTDPSNEEGMIVTYNAGREGYAVVVLDRSSLENPFFITEKEGYRTLLRDGTMPFIDIPVVESGGVDGMASFPDGKPVPGMRVQLVSQGGEVVKETPTASDGFFSFEFVKPGQYTLRVDPEQKLRVRDKTIEVAQNNLFAYGINMNILPPPELTPRKRKLFKSVVGKLKDIQNVFQNI